MSVNATDGVDGQNESTPQIGGQTIGAPAGYRWYEPVSIAHTQLVEHKHRKRATCLWCLLWGSMVVYMVFAICFLFYKPKVITAGIERSDEWGRWPTLYVCHDGQLPVYWHNADLFVRHFQPHIEYNLTDPHDFTVTVNQPLAEPSGQGGGSCLKFSTNLSPFPNVKSLAKSLKDMKDAAEITTTTTTTTSHDQQDPQAWYIFDFRVTLDKQHLHLRPNRFGVPGTLYLIAEDDTGYKSLIGTVNLPRGQDHITSTMIEVEKTKTIKDGDWNFAKFTGLVPGSHHHEYHGVQHNWETLADTVTPPEYPVDCSSTTTDFSNRTQSFTRAATFCNNTTETKLNTTTETELNTVVVLLTVSKHDVRVRNKFSAAWMTFTALGAFGGFASTVAAIYSLFVVKKFKPSYHEVLTWGWPTWRWPFPLSCCLPLSCCWNGDPEATDRASDTYELLNEGEQHESDREAARKLKHNLGSAI